MGRERTNFSERRHSEQNKRTNIRITSKYKGKFYNPFFLIKFMFQDKNKKSILLSRKEELKIGRY
jgi:hypothetical protein